MSRVILNIGGTRYETSTSTLGRYPDSMLSRLIMQPTEKEMIENGEELFIDRDGKNFVHVLEYLRHGSTTLNLPLDNEILRKSLFQEADFYGLTGLTEFIKRGGVFEVDDLVQLRDENGFSWLKSVITTSNWKTICCFKCHKEIDTLSGQGGGIYKVKEPEATWKTIIGKIIEIIDDCAMVGYPESSLLDTFAYIQSYEEWDCDRLDAELDERIFGEHYQMDKPTDKIKVMHMPLMTLKVKI